MAKQHRILTGQVAAITGAARGIGRATAQAFLREGMKVAIGDLDFATAQQTAKELGHGTVAFQLDVTQRATASRRSSARSTCWSTTRGSCRSATRSGRRTTPPPSG
jgi:NAD(P)-dependent dehydrogenase (short-subunit alcohol dehydrogenase family)